MLQSRNTGIFIPQRRSKTEGVYGFKYEQWRDKKNIGAQTSF